MGLLLLISRLALRDLRHRPVEAVLVLLAITAATATLTLGLVVRSVATGPSYEQTRTATAGPDVVATNLSAAGLAGVLHQARKAGAVAIGGPYPVAGVVIQANGYTAGVTAEGRDSGLGAVDRPLVTSGSWVRPGGVVFERSFGVALGLRVGQWVTLDGRSYRVTGIAVTAASPPYPETGFMATPPGVGDDPGLVWLTRADAISLATRTRPLTYTVDVRTPDPAALAGPAGFSGPWTSSQAISAQDAKEVSNEQLVLTVGGWLLGLLAVASVGVLVGGRLAEQTRRVGLLKAAGSTPGLVAAILLAEYLALALCAAAIGLIVGRLIAPALTSLSFFAGLSARPATPPVTPQAVGVVAGVAVAVAVVSTLVPALRAARTPTVRALADAARSPKRHALATRLSATLPVPLLLGLRLAARRPRRSLLNAATVAITVTTVVAVLIYRATKGQSPPGVAVVAGAPSANPASQVIAVLTVVLIVLAAINAVFTAWATVLDGRYPAALARALGTTPRQLTAGLSASQLLPALPGAIVGVPAGIALYAAVNSGGELSLPPASWLVAVVLAVLAAVALLTAIPARIGASHPVVGILQSEAT
jgi:predicted lysophospholipase L1 biosynthesis ABC-type transport system permease subunit